MQYCSTEPCSSLGRIESESRPPTWQQRNSNLQCCSAEPRPSPGRIEGESEPPNLATEKNAGRGVSWARNPPSPVRMRATSTAKTPRNRGIFKGYSWPRAGILCIRKLGGGESGIRTHGTFRYTRFPSVRLKPLGHLSGSFPLLAGADSPRSGASSERR